jgi:hypothetical protein
MSFSRRICTDLDSIETPVAALPAGLGMPFFVSVARVSRLNFQPGEVVPRNDAKEN